MFSTSHRPVFGNDEHVGIPGLTARRLRRLLVIPE
jgi:hypothetical protein